MQVGRPGKDLEAGREKLARLAAFLEGGRGVAKDAQAAVAAYQQSTLRLMWMDAGNHPNLCNLLRLKLYPLTLSSLNAPVLPHIDRHR